MPFSQLGLVQKEEPIGNLIGDSFIHMIQQLEGDYKILTPVFQTPAQGASTVLFLATSPDIKSISGEYFYKMKKTNVSDATNDPELAKRLWAWSEKRSGLLSSLLMKRNVKMFNYVDSGKITKVYLQAKLIKKKGV